MATEFRLNYTGSEINRKLETVDETKSNLENNYYTSVEIDTKLEEVNTSIENKADLIGGKIPASQLPEDIGGGVTSWNDLEDKPFGEEGWSIEWDGTPTDEFVETDLGTFYKVSDLLITKEEIIESTLSVNHQDMTVEEMHLIDLNECCYVVAELIIITSQATTVVDMGLEFPSAGVWFMYNPDMYVSCLGKGEIKTLDEKYIPDTIARKSDIPEIDLSGKADLVDGKVPLEQLPDDIGSGGGLTEVSWEDIKNKPEITTEITENSQAIITSGAIYELIGDCNAVINSINALVGGEGV